MNKQNSMVVQNEMSTQIGDTLKSYSSKFKQQKQLRSLSLSRNDILPVKLERAAVTIQRFWRRRMVLRRRLNNALIEEFEYQNDLLEFQNQSLSHLLSVYSSDCALKEGELQKQADEVLGRLNEEGGEMIRRMVGLTFQMERRQISPDEQTGLEQEMKLWKLRAEELTAERQALQGLLGGELHEEEQNYMRRIKEHNLQLLNVSRERAQLEQHIREKLIEICKTSINNNNY